MDEENKVRLQYRIENTGNKSDYGLFALTNGVMQPFVVESTEIEMYKVTLDKEETAFLDISFTPVFLNEEGENFFSFQLMLDPDRNLPDKNAWYSQRITQTRGWRIKSTSQQASVTARDIKVSDDFLMYSANKEFQVNSDFNFNLKSVSSDIVGTKKTFHEFLLQFSAKNDAVYRVYLCYNNSPLGIFNGMKYIDVKLRQGVEYISFLSIDSTLLTELNKSIYIIATVLSDDIDSYESYKSNSIILP